METKPKNWALLMGGGVVGVAYSPTNIKVPGSRPAKYINIFLIQIFTSLTFDKRLFFSSYLYRVIPSNACKSHKKIIPSV